MKSILFTLFGVLLFCNLQAQAVFDLKLLPVCWQLSAEQDSTIYAYWLMSSRAEEPQLVSYLNISGQEVNVSSGSISPGLCCCQSGGGANTIDATRLNQDSILIYTINGAEVGRDTIPLADFINLSITRLGDGVFQFNVGGNITTIHNRTDSIYTDGPLIIGGITFSSNTDLQTILEAITNNLGDPPPLGDTIFQASHAFTVGTMLSQLATNGDYFPASTLSPDSFPVAMVVEVLHPDTFIIDGSGWIRTTSLGLQPGTDYYLQDNATYGTTPDATYNIFAFRTSSVVPGKVYFDIPEAVLASGGSGGNNYAVTASNGLNDQDSSTDVDVELGGSLERNTTVSTNGFDMLVTGLNNGDNSFWSIPTSADQVLIAARDLDGSQTDVTVSTRGLTSVFRTAATDPNQIISNISQDASSLLLSHTRGGTNNYAFVLTINESGYTFSNVPAYASDAAADADANLPAGGIYTVSGDRSLRIKP